MALVLVVGCVGAVFSQDKIQPNGTLLREQPTATDLRLDSEPPKTPAEPLKTSLPKSENRLNKNGVYELTFDDLSFEMEKDDDFKRSMLTPQINNFDQSKIKLRGYIRPSFSQSGLTKFVFVRDNKECCFGPGAALYDCVLVKLADGKKTDYTVRPITIEGTFYLKEYEGPDGKIWSIYRLKDGQISR